MVLLRTRRNLLKALLSKYIDAFPDIVTFSHWKNNNKKKKPFLFMELCYTVKQKVFSAANQQPVISTRLLINWGA